MRRPPRYEAMRCAGWVAHRRPSAWRQVAPLPFIRPLVSHFRDPALQDAPDPEGFDRHGLAGDHGDLGDGAPVDGDGDVDSSDARKALRIAAGMKDFDYDAFFRAYADLFLTKDTLQMSYIRINDVHPMRYLRVNCTLQQFDEFLDFYGITEGDGMYLAPADRVIIW